LLSLLSKTFVLMLALNLGLSIMVRMYDFSTVSRCVSSSSCAEAIN
jgi:hypothetical protein